MTDAERQRIIDQRALEELLARSPGRRGQRPLREILSDAVIEPGTREEFEHAFVQFCHEAKLPRPTVNTYVEGYEVDVLWPRQKLIAELDSWAFHRHRKAFEDDRERDITLQLAGYRVVRITWRQLTREPRKLAASLRGLL
jgi:very-short-patch-repair endonuclease